MPKVKLGPLLLSLLVGCSGTDIGNPVGTSGDENAGRDGCEAVGRRKLPRGQASALGFSGDDMLAVVSASVPQSIRWSSTRQLEVGPESGEQPLTFAVEAAGADAYLVDYERKSSGGEIDDIGGIDCADQLEVEVDVKLVSGGGALNESVRTRLVAARPELVSAYESVQVEDVQGALTLRSKLTEPGWEAKTIRLALQATKHGLSGSLSSNLERTTSDSVGQAASDGPFATFGLPSCSRGVSIPLDAQGMAVAPLLSALPTSATLVSGAGVETAATLQFEAPEHACYEPNAIDGSGAPRVYVLGTLTVKSQDGNFDARWPAMATAAPGGDTLSFVLDSSARLPDGSFAERYGITQLDVSAYQYATLDVMLAAASRWSGTITVYGSVAPDCPPPVVMETPGGGSGSPGCPGGRRETVEQYTVR